MTKKPVLFTLSLKTRSLTHKWRTKKRHYYISAQIFIFKNEIISVTTDQLQKAFDAL